MASNVLRDAIIAHIQKSSSEQSSTQITQGIALQGLINQELPALVEAGVLVRTKTGGYTSKASIAQQLAAKELETQQLRLAMMDEAPAPAIAAAPADASAMAADPAKVG